LVAFYLFRIIHGVIIGQGGQSMRATIVDLPMVVVGTMGFGFLCYTLLSIIDAFSDPMIDGFATTLNDTVTQLYSQEGLVKGGLFVFIFAVLYIAAAIFLCFELFVRSSLIYLVIMFAPLAIATRIWGPTRNYARRATETAVALIFAKLAIAVTLATGASLMNTASTSGGTVEMIQGSAILLLAAFMPFALMRVIPIMEGAVAGEGVARNMGTKAAVAGYGATKAASAATAPVSSAAGAIKAKWDGRQSSSGANGGDGDGSPGSGGDSGGASPAGGGTKPGGPTPTGSPSSSAAPSSATEASSEAGASSSKPAPGAKSTPSPSPSKPTVEGTPGAPTKSQPSPARNGTATAQQSHSSVSGAPSRPSQQAAPPSATPLGTTRNQQRSEPPNSATAPSLEAQQTAGPSRTQSTPRVPVPQTPAKPAQSTSKETKR
jgi:type IV secretion system protein TrbL